jgi:hypothetical protein
VNLLTDADRLALIVSAKESFRAAQRTRTWEQRVAAIARMNAANKIANKKLLAGEGLYRAYLEKKYR